MKNPSFPSIQWLFIFGITFGIGLLLSLQFRSFALVKKTFLRDQNSNIFREIQILKRATDQLKKEKVDLIAQKEEFTSRFSQVEALKKETEKYQLLSDGIAVAGPGVRVEIRRGVDTLWFIDLVNDFVTAGAEAISINGVRMGASHSGFRSLGENTLLLGDLVLRPPYRIEAIGEIEVLTNTLLQPGSTLLQLESTLKNEKIRFSKHDQLVFEPF